VENEIFHVAVEQDVSRILPMRNTTWGVCVDMTIYVDTHTQNTLMNAHTLMRTQAHARRNAHAHVHAHARAHAHAHADAQLHTQAQVQA